MSYDIKLGVKVEGTKDCYALIAESTTETLELKVCDNESSNNLTWNEVPIECLYIHW